MRDVYPRRSITSTATRPSGSASVRYSAQTARRERDRSDSAHVRELNLSKPIESSYCEVKPFWERASARLRDRIPKCVYKLWRRSIDREAERRQVPRVASRAKKTTNRASAQKNTALASNNHDFERETVEDSESDEEMRAAELSDSDFDAQRRPSLRSPTPESPPSASPRSPKSKIPPSSRAPLSAKTSCLCSNREQAPCGGVPIDAVLAM